MYIPAAAAAVAEAVCQQPEEDTNRHSQTHCRNSIAHYKMYVLV